MSSGASELDAKMKSAFEGNFIDATDIKGVAVELTISKVVAPSEEKDAAGKKIDKAILSFDKATKRMILNKTNAKILRMLHGPKASEWVGKRVSLCVRYLETAFGQRNVPVVRVLVPVENLTFGMRKKYGSETPFV